MTSFADPDLIACPHCEQKFLRQVLRSFTNKWEVTYSDGGSAFGLEHLVFDVTRCTHCCEIMLDVQSITSLATVRKASFWKRWFTKEIEYLRLPRPTSDVFLELFEKATSADEKMAYALKAYRVFNQTHHLEDKNIQPNDSAVRQYQAAAEHILASPPKHYMPEYDLLCADIYRQRGQFDKALEIYTKVSEEKFQHIVEQCMEWATKKQKRLMEIRSKEQHYVDKNGPIAPPENKVFCNIEEKYHCPKHWNDLSRVDGKLKQRFCDKCNQNVYHCSSLKQFKYHSSKQHCIAADIEQLKLEGKLMSKLEPELTVGLLDFAKYEVDGVATKN